MSQPIRARLGAEVSSTNTRAGPFLVGHGQHGSTPVPATSFPRGRWRGGQPAVRRPTTRAATAAAEPPMEWAPVTTSSVARRGQHGLDLGGGAERVGAALHDVHGDAVGRRRRAAPRPATLRLPRRVQREGQCHDGARAHRGCRAAGDPGPGAAAAHDERSRRRGRVPVPRAPAARPGPGTAVPARPSTPRPATAGRRARRPSPRRPPPRGSRGRRGSSAAHRRRGRARGRRRGCRAAGSAVARAGPSGVSTQPFLRAAAGDGRAHPSPPMTSPVSGSTTPTSSSAGSGSSSCGPLDRLLLTARDTG